MKYGVILADPPWAFRAWSPKGDGRSASRHYQVMNLADIKALDVASLAGRDAVLLLWATNPLLPEAISVLQAWGFTYTTMATWAKVGPDGRPQIGTGYYLRGATEHLLIGKKGNPARPARALPSLILAPRAAHSEKPVIQYEYAEQFPGPYLELFGRPRNLRRNWTTLGFEVTGEDIRDDIARAQRW